MKPLNELTVPELREQLSTAERVLKIIKGAEDQKAVYGFMVDVTDLIESKLREQ